MYNTFSPIPIAWPPPRTHAVCWHAGQVNAHQTRMPEPCQIWHCNTDYWGSSLLVVRGCWEKVLYTVHMFSIHLVFTFCFSEICPFLPWHFWLKTNCDCKVSFSQQTNWFAIHRWLMLKVKPCDIQWNPLTEYFQRIKVQSNLYRLVFLKMGGCSKTLGINYYQVVSSIHHFEKCRCIDIIYPICIALCSPRYLKNITRHVQQHILFHLLLERAAELSPWPRLNLSCSSSGSSSSAFRRMLVLHPSTHYSLVHQNRSPSCLYYTLGIWAQVVILLILLVWWLDLPPQGDPYQVIEMFAGVGRIAGLSKFAGFKSAAIDIEYAKERWERVGKRSPMDINSDAGLLSRVCITVFFQSGALWKKEWSSPYIVINVYYIIYIET